MRYPASRVWIVGAAILIGALLACGKSGGGGGGDGCPCGLPPDIYEPNDTRTGCWSIVLDFHETDLTLHEGSDEDYYCFTLATDSRVDVTATFVHADGDIDIELLDGAGLIVDESKTLQDIESTSTLLAAGPYSVRVFSPTAEANVYGLDITVQGGILPDRFEDNNDIPSCTPTILDFQEAGLTIHDTLDEDYFCITLAHSGTLTITATFIHQDGDIDIALLDSGGLPIASSETQQAPEVIVASVSFGWYYVRVWSPTGETNTYDLEILKQ